jgi:hypothetical protein
MGSGIWLGDIMTVKLVSEKSRHTGELRPVVVVLFNVSYWEPWANNLY